MPDPETSASPQGIRAAIDGFKTQAARYAGARLALLRLEASEAAEVTSRRLRYGITAGILLFFGYALLLAGLIGVAEHYRPGTWPMAAIIAAVCHFFMAIPLLRGALRKGDKPLFGESLQQMKNDEQWMRSLKNQDSTKNPPTT
ncbi:MAG: phage holin family protein [Verrucomicrobiales bacterium]